MYIKGYTQLALVVKNWPANAGEIRSKAPFLGQEGVATRFSVLAWRIQWTEELGGLQSIGSRRVGHDWSNLARMHTKGYKTVGEMASALACLFPAMGSVYLNNSEHEFLHLWLEDNSILFPRATGKSKEMVCVKVVSELQSPCKWQLLLACVQMLNLNNKDYSKHF